MSPTSSLIEWLKLDCLFPNKNHRRKKKRSTPPPSPTSTTAAPATARRKPLTLEEHLSSASSAPTGRGVRKPFPKRVHPSSSSSSSSSLSTAGGRQGKGKGKSNSFTLETLVKLDRESKDDYFSENSSRSNLVVAGDGSGVGLAVGSRSRRREGKKNGKRVRFTLPGDGDVYVFYSPRAPINRPFTLFETS